MARVTVFIPVYNAEKYLKETIESILNQTFEDFELLLINDGSTDRSVEIINSFDDKRIKLVNNEKNMGLPFTRNRALDFIESEYIALMDSDDIANKDRLKEEIEFLDKNKEIDVVGSDFVMFFPDGEKKYVRTPSNPEYIKAHLIFSICIANPSTMLRNSFIKKYNLRYRNDFFVCQDYSFWVDVCKFGNISNINKPLLYYRSGHDNISKRSSEKKAQQRKQLLDRIHIRALKHNNIVLSNDELKTFNKCFDDSVNKIISIKDINLLYNIMTKIYKECCSLDKDILQQVIIKNFYIKLKESNLSLKEKLTYINKINKYYNKYIDRFIFSVKLTIKHLI